MSIFSYFTGTRNQTKAFQKTSNKGLLDSEMDKELSYDDVRDLYSNFSLANRIVNLPINLACSNIQTNLKELNEEVYNKIDLDGIIDKVKELAIHTRVYGLGVLIPRIKDDDLSKPLLKSELYDKEIRYNVIDPILTSCDCDLDPTSFSFMKLKRIQVNGKEIHKNRCLALTNNNTRLFRKYNKAGYSFTGLSVYQSIFKPLQLLNTALISLDRQLIHSSLLILKQEDSKITTSNLQQQNLEEAARLMDQVRQNSTIILKNGMNLEQFQLSNLTNIQDLMKQVIELMGLSTDIPAIIFSGDKLSNGFTEGSEEMLQLQEYLTPLRKGIISPTLKFILTYEIYNKCKDIQEADYIERMLEISYGSTALKKEIIENSDKLQETGVMNKDDINRQITEQ